MKKLTTAAGFLSIAIFGFLATPAHAQVILGITVTDLSYFPYGGITNMNTGLPTMTGTAAPTSGTTVTSGNTSGNIGNSGSQTRYASIDFGTNFANYTLTEVLIAVRASGASVGDSPFSNMWFTPTATETSFNPITDTAATFQVGTSSLANGGTPKWNLDVSGLSVVLPDEYLIVENAVSGNFYDGAANQVLFAGNIAGASTPEPSTLVLLGLGVLGLGVAFRRRSIA